MAIPLISAAQCTTNVNISSSSNSDTVCAGSSVTLTASGVALASYSWGNGATTSSIMVTVETTSEYYISVVDSNSCTGIDSITINADQFNISLPTTYNVCANSGSGGTTGGGTLYPSISGGGVHPYTFLWSNGVTTAGLPLAGITSGSYTLTANDANNCEPVTAVVTINVDSLKVIANTVTAATCPGSIAVMGANITGGIGSGFGYQWSNGGTNSTDSIITAINNGSTVGAMYSITITDSVGCSATNWFSVFPTDNLGIQMQSALNVCGGGSGPSTVIGGGGLCPMVYGGTQPYTYTWNVSSAGNTPCLSLQGLSAGDYYVSVSDSSGCTVTAVCKVTFSSPPNVSITCNQNVVHPGSWDTLTASGATNYFWSNGTTGSQLIVQAFHTHEYWVYGYDSLDRCGASAQMPVIVTLDPWLPSPDTTLSWNSPIYFPGNVAIGLTTPKYNLEVKGTVSADSVLLIGQADSNKGISINGATASITSPTQTVSFGNDTVATTGTVKAGSIITTNLTIRDTLIVPAMRTDRIIALLGDSDVHIGDSSVAFNNATNYVYGTTGGIGMGSGSKPGSGAIGIGSSNKELWGGSIAIGLANNVKQPNSIAMGFNNIIQSSNASDDFFITIGSGLTNSIKGSIMMGGYNSSSHTPAFSIIPDMTNGTVGFVGIGTTSPTALVDIEQNSTSHYSTGLIVQSPPIDNDYGIIDNVNRVALHVKAFAIIDNTGMNNLDIYGNGNILWGINNLCWSDQGGAIELGGTNATANIVTGGTPYFDFHYGNGVTQDYNARIINQNDGELDINCWGSMNPGPYQIAAFIGNSNGNYVRAQEIKVCVTGCDFVFDDNYKLMPLNELEDYLQLNRHLPGIPSALEMGKGDGVALGKMNSQLLQKVEELTLYDIQLKKELDELKAEVVKLKESK